MISQNNSQIIQQLNTWGRHRTPFLFMIDFEMQKPLAFPLAECPRNIYYNFQGKTNYPYSERSLSSATINKRPVEFKEYQKKFNKAVTHLNRGDSFLLNLTDRTQIELTLDFNHLFNNTQSKYSLWLQGEFICFSPETFVEIKEGKIYTYPMKGTIDHSLLDAERTLTLNPKEQAEHATIVDLMRNDLSRIAKKVRVEKYRYYETLKTHDKVIGQMSSKIVGELEDPYLEHLGDYLYKLLPAGSISGAPKKKTVELIQEIEGQARGYYTGVAFYFDGENLDSCVLIRYLEANGTYRSGGGITSKSNAHQEYQELIDKVYVPIY